jgi:integrase
MIKPYRTCSCRGAPAIGADGRKRPGKLLGKACPRLKTDSKHGHWYARYEAPAGETGKRHQPRLGPFGTEKAAKAALVEALGEVQTGKHTSDRNTRLAAYADRWLAWRAAEVKPSTLESYEEAFSLYWKPALGHLRLADIRDSHIRDVHAAMRKLNTPAEAEDRSEMLRRLAAARGTWHGKRFRRRPLTDARIRRVTAPLVKALNDCKALPVNPAAGIGGKVRRIRPLVWTEPRVAQWRKDGKRPASVMVWTAAQCGQFLDVTESDRLYALYHLACYWGLRRGELERLEWADLDLGARRLHVRGDVKSEDSDRIVTIDQGTADVLETWRERQLFERLEWDAAWQDSGRVFTREDGSPLRRGWASEHFKALVHKAALPPIRFHDLRHGTATMLLAAGQPIKVISEILGHATSAFTADIYTEVAQELADAAAVAIAAFVPRKSTGRASNVPASGENEH